MNINKYIKEQDELVTAFTDGLTNSIGNSLSRKQDNLSLIISNQLNKLWNDSWNLGRTHAIDETPPSLFSYSDSIAEFASPLEKLRNEIDKITKEKEGYQSELDRIRRDYQDKEGNYSGTKILRSIDKEGTYNDVDKVRAIQVIRKREDELTALIAAKDNLIKDKQDKFFELTDPANIAKLNELSKDTKDVTPEVLPRVNKAEVNQQLSKAVRDRDAWRKSFVDENGNLNLAKYRRVKGYDTSDSDADVLKQMKREELDLINEVKRHNQTLNDINDRSTSTRTTSIKEQALIDKQKRRIERQLKKQQNLQTTKLDANKIPANIRDSVQAIESRRQIESTRGDVPLLEQTEFGKSYLNRRINTIGNDLNSRYKDTLKQVIPEYLADNKQDKDITYYRRISAMLTREDAKQMEQYNKQLELIKTRLDDIPTKLTATKDMNVYESVAFLKQKYDPDVKLTITDKKLLNELPDKAVYKMQDLRAYRDKLLEKVRKLKDNQARTKRIAITEMGHAYNLGRLDYYIKQDIKFVKWNNSIEHKEHKRAMIPGDYNTRYRKIYNKLSELINRSPQLESFKMDGIVCPICQERAIYDYGYGKGIIKIDDLLSNSQSQPLLHANCSCFLTSVEESETKEPFNVPIYISSLLNNNVVKWATAGILGTAAMYAAFKKSNVTPLNIPDIIRSKPAVVTTKALSQALLDDIIDVPLVPLQIPERVPTTINIDRANKVLEDVVNWRTNTIDESITKAIEIDNRYELVNPFMTATTESSVDDITTRVKQYNSITKATLTKDDLNQFKEDVDKIQHYINEIEDANTKIYSSIQSMKLARKAIIDEGLNKLSDELIPPGFTPEQVIISNPIIQRLDNQIIQSENTLRNAISLKLGETSHYSTLKRIRNDLLDNELFKLEYIKRKRGVLLRLQDKLIGKFDKVKKVFVGGQVNPRVLERDLEELQNTILSNYMNVSNEQFESYVRQLDNIELAIDGQLELIKNKLGLTSLDARNYTGNDMAVLTSEFISDYKNGLMRSKLRAMGLRNLLIDVK
jgi:hypothetical protein